MDASAPRPNVLVAYGYLQHPLRATYHDHLYSFGRYGRARYFYVNLGARRVPQWLGRFPFDAVILHHSMTGQRMAPPVFSVQMRRARVLKELAPTRIAFMQDETIFCDVLSDLINELDIDHVFSVAPESEWRKMYRVDHDRVRFHYVLPGYLDDEAVRRIDRIVAETNERPIDIGYRSWEGVPSLGRQGLLRREVAEAVEPAAKARGMRTDISYSSMVATAERRKSDVFHGDDWYRFMASCKYMIGAEGGASMLDGRGEFMLRTYEYISEHPDASFEEIEAACFPGEDGTLELFAISPRHIEACATRTCQVLVEGNYSGVLRPGEHYIELKRDFSNLDEVIDRVERDEDRARITEAAYRDVVASGRYSYRTMVEQVERETGILAVEPREPDIKLAAKRHHRSQRADRRSWWKVASIARAVRALRRAGELVLTPRMQDRLRLIYARRRSS